MPTTCIERIKLKMKEVILVVVRTLCATQLLHCICGTCHFLVKRPPTRKSSVDVHSERVRKKTVWKIRHKSNRLYTFLRRLAYIKN